MSIYFIDYENVNLNGLSGIETLTEQDRVYIFYGANPGYIPFERHIAISKSRAEVNYLRVDRTAKNYLDFQLATYSGYLVAMYADPEYIIISRDTGFDSIVNFWNRDPEGRGVHFSRREAIVPQPARTVPQVASFPSSAPRTAPASREFVPTRIAPVPPIPQEPAPAPEDSAVRSPNRRRRGRRGGRGEERAKTATPAPLSIALPIDNVDAVTTSEPLPEPPILETVVEPMIEELLEVSVEIAENAEEPSVENEQIAEILPEMPEPEPIPEPAPALVSDPVSAPEPPPAPDHSAWDRVSESHATEGAVGAVIRGASAQAFKPMPVFPFMKKETIAPISEEIVPESVEKEEDLPEIGVKIPEIAPEMSEIATETTEKSEIAPEVVPQTLATDLQPAPASSRTRKPREKTAKQPAPAPADKPKNKPKREKKAPEPPVLTPKPTQNEEEQPPLPETTAPAKKEKSAEPRLPERFKSRIREAVKEEGFSSGGYTQIYNRILKCDSKSRLNNELVKAFSQEKGSRVYKLVLPVYEEYRKTLE